MPIYVRDGKSILHIHVPKTGGRTILEIFKTNGFTIGLVEMTEKKFSDNWFRRCSPQHMHRSLLEQNLRLDRFDFIFVTTRHPIARFKSEFVWRHRESPDPPSDIEQWANQILEEYAGDPFILDNHIRPQADFLLPNAVVFRQENGFDDEWVIQLEKLLGVEMPEKTVRRLHNSEEFSKSPSSAIEVSAALQRRLEFFYSVDFDLFGY